ncbi:hypothetical protein BJV74DRAFT_199691 [Russula compacta]|nr:hypothetical protein BJV74DRAFT_199691 [Russula compacta]
MQKCQHHNYVSTIRPRTISFPSSARRRAPTPAFHPTTLCLILSIASTRFLAFSKQSEATSDTAAHTSILILAYLSFLFSMLGTLSGVLSSFPICRNTYQDLPASAVNNLTQTCMLNGPRRLPAPLWLIQRSWDYSSMCTFASLLCFTALVWLYVYIFEPFSVRAVSIFAVGVAFSVVLRRLRTSSCFMQ